MIEAKLMLNDWSIGQRLLFPYSIQPKLFRISKFKRSRIFFTRAIDDRVPTYSKMSKLVKEPIKGILESYATKNLANITKVSEDYTSIIFQSWAAYCEDNNITWEFDIDTIDCEAVNVSCLIAQGPSNIDSIYGFDVMAFQFYNPDLKEAVTVPRIEDIRDIIEGNPRYSIVYWIKVNTNELYRLTKSNKPSQKQEVNDYVQVTRYFKFATSLESDRDEIEWKLVDIDDVVRNAILSLGLDWPDAIKHDVIPFDKFWIHTI